jgi:hypothetical protein
MVSSPVWEICERVAGPQTFETRPTSDNLKDWRQVPFAKRQSFGFIPQKLVPTHYDCGEQPGWGKAGVLYGSIRRSIPPG